MTAETAGIVVAAARGMDAPRKKKWGGEEEEEEMEENFSHMCKICKKKFVSGRAFGGHMRIHGPVATAHAAAEQGRGLAAWKAEGGEEEEEEEGGFEAQDGSAMYALRRHRKRSWRISDRDFSLLMDGDDPSRGCCSCEACGRDFASWKSLIGHMKCHADPLWKTREEADGRGWEWSRESERPAEGGEDGESGNEIESPGRRAANSGSFERWMKGKRSKRPRHARDHQAGSDHGEEEDVAMCLVMLSRGGLSGSTEGSEAERPKKPKAGRRQPDGDLETGRAGSYECATCNKVFPSHQALGGHRASHKKAWHHGTESPEEEITDEELMTGSDRRFQRPAPKDASSEESCGIPPKPGKGRVHECSICHRVFPTGQALGGHKRCHWTTPGGASETTSTVSSTREAPLQQRPARAGLLDLNEPAPAEEDHCAPTDDAAKGSPRWILAGRPLLTWNPAANSAPSAFLLGRWAVITRCADCSCTVGTGSCLRMTRRTARWAPELASAGRGIGYCRELQMAVDTGRRKILSFFGDCLILLHSS